MKDTGVSLFSFTEIMDDITVKGNEIHATAGALLSQIAAAAKMRR